MADFNNLFGNFVDPTVPDFVNYPQNLSRFLRTYPIAILDGPSDVKRFAARTAQEIGKHLSGAISHIPLVDNSPRIPGFTSESDRLRNRLSTLHREILRSSNLFHKSRVFPSYPILGSTYTNYWNSAIVQFAEELVCDISSALGYVYNYQNHYFPSLSISVNYDHFNESFVTLRENEDYLLKDSLILEWDGTPVKLSDYAYLQDLRFVFEPIEEFETWLYRTYK
jgi:hypothetical protein